MARIIHLYTDVAELPTAGGLDVDTTFGFKFTLLEAMWVTQLRWFRYTSGTNEVPANLGLFDLSTNEQVVDVGTTADDGFPGWQANTLDTPLLLPKDHDYAVAAFWPADRNFTYTAYGSIPPPTIPNVTIEALPGLTTTDAWPAPPTTAWGSLAPVLDVTLQRDPVDTAAITRADLDLILDQWLGPGEANLSVTHQGYIPKLLLGMQAQFDNVVDVIYQTQGTDPVTTTDVMTYLNTNLGTTAEWAASAHPKLVSWLAALLAVLADALTTLAFLHDLFPSGHTPTDHDASLAAHRAATEPDGETLPAFIEGEMEIVLTAITDQTNEITQILAHGNGTEDVATIVGESDWGNIFRFDVPADFYVVDVTTTDLDATSEDVAGTRVWDHLGFCIPLTVDGLPEYGPRLAIGGQVIRTGRQMGGIILNGRRVLSGHVTAYQYQAP